MNERIDLLCHIRNSDGYTLYKKWSNGEEWRFDEKGKFTYQKFVDGKEYWYGNGLITHVKWPNGDEAWFDAKGPIHAKWSNGDEDWFDENGNSIKKGSFNFVTHSYEKKIEAEKKRIYGDK